MKISWLTLYAISAAAVLIAILFGIPLLYLVAKPLLMMMLLAYFLSASKGYPGWRIMVVLALIFSWGGDVFLMLDDMFIAGLASFLVAHIFYIISYQKTGAAQGRIRPFDLVAFALYGIALMWVLYPGLGGMLVPVMVYALVLLTMGVWAHKRRGFTTSISFKYVSTGVILFVISDSLIAINKFAYEIPPERLLVMSTYITAQFMIVQGLLKHEESEQEEQGSESSARVNIE
jgi:uncharacterized membrane protein YhhN